jgi:hypothetical protein
MKSNNDNGKNLGEILAEALGEGTPGFNGEMDIEEAKWERQQKAP